MLKTASVSKDIWTVHENIVINGSEEQVQIFSYALGVFFGDAEWVFKQCG